MIKAACHIHSDWSYDGTWTLAEIAAEFGRRGYQALFVTEHDRGFTEERRLTHRAACAAVSTDELFVVPGIEYSDADNRVHVLVWGEVPFVGENVPTLQVLRATQAAGGIAVLAHPSRRDMWRCFDPEWMPYLSGIEIWNRKTDGWAPSRPALRLVEGSTTRRFAGIDFHTSKQLFPLAMELPGAFHPDEAHLVDCLRHPGCVATFRDTPLDRVIVGLKGFELRMAETVRRSLARTYRSLAGRRRG